MADDEELNYFEAISLLKEMNLPLPDGVENVADPAIFPDMRWPPFEHDAHASGDDLQGVPHNQHGIGNAAESYAIENAYQPASTNAGDHVNSDSQAMSSQVSSGTKKLTALETEKIASYFIADEVNEDGKLVKRSTCKGPRCPVFLYTHATRRRKFHVMNCVDIDYGTRKYYHDKSKAKDKPPLLRYPSPGVTVAGARNIVKSLAGEMLDTALNCLINPDAWEADPLFSKFASKRSEVNESRPSNEISPVEEDISHHLLTRLIVEENLPFSTLSRPGGKDRSFAQYAKFVRPAITLPSATTVSTVLLDSYYEIIKSRVKSDIINQLCEGYATLMFDSAEDVNQAPMTNVLVRLTGPSRANVKTYYLTTAFTETAKSNTAMYKAICEPAVKVWVGYEKLAVIVTDNTSNVKKAREEMMNEHDRLVASQDHGHVADKLMQDIGTISWISDVIKTVSRIVVHYRRYRKVKVRITQKIKERNNQMRRVPLVDEHEEGPQRPPVRDRRESNTERPHEEPIEAAVPVPPGADADVSRSLADGRNHLASENEMILSHLLDSSYYPVPASLIDLAAEGYHSLQQEVDEHDEDEAEPLVTRLLPLLNSKTHFQRHRSPFPNHLRAEGCLHPSLQVSRA